MEVTPITQLISSWTDLSLEVDVIELGQSTANSPVVQWSLERVKQRFKAPDKHSPIICPQLHATAPPDLITEARMARINVATSLPLTFDDLFFLAQRVLGQSGAFQTWIDRKFDTYIWVEEGSLLLFIAKKELTVEERRTLEQKPMALDVAAFQPSAIPLLKGNKMFLAASSMYAILFLEDSLFTTGNIAPPLEETNGTINSLCKICSAIPFDKLPFEEDAGYPHQPSISDLIVSSKTCGLCNLIHGAIRDIQKDFDMKCLRTHGLNRNRAGDGVFTNRNRFTNERFAVRQISKRIAGVEINQIALASPAQHLFVETAGELDRVIQVLSHQLYEDKQHQDSCIERPWLYGNWWVLPKTSQCPYQLIGLGVRLSRKPVVQVSPEIGEAELETWVRLCDEGHKCAPGKLKLPTRVLDVTAAQINGKVRLIETHGMEGVYITLSHCWGPSQPLPTTSATLQSHKEGILFSQLPKTFQDAVIISRRLGIRYLWIDSLCIIQGDSEDWERESSKMADVYSQSWLTIAASASTGADSGCFPVRKSSTYTPPDCLSTGLNESRSFDVKTPFHAENSPPAMLYFTNEWMPTSFKANPRLYQIGSFGSFFDPVENEPLNKRGWTLQERYLSPRVVHYAKDQVFFQCGPGIAAEDGARFENLHSKSALMRYTTVDRHGVDSEDMYPIRAYDGDTVFHIDDSICERMMTGWNFLVEIYSRRELTYDNDKLPALSGIASLVAHETNDEYFAGLWKQYILQDLLWRAYPYEEDHPSWRYRSYQRQTIPCKRLSTTRYPSSYRAPTWSWAAVDGSIKFEQLSRRYTCAQFCDAFVKPVGNNAFGRVESGWIKITVSTSRVLQ